MLRWGLVLSGVLLWTHGPAARAQAWSLQWGDEFNGTAHSTPDPAAWGYDTGGGGYGNGEIEVYCAPGSGVAPCDARRASLSMDGEGHMVIHAVRTDGVWTSGRMKTEGKKSFTYGRMEARMRWTVAAGFWPAFWMLGDGVRSVGWPKAGEQDIMEWVQKYGPGKTSSTVHGPGYSGGKGIGSTFTFPDGGHVDDAFHTYGVVWSENKLEFYRDSPAQPYLTVTPKDLPPGAAWVYNQPFFLLLNFAIGGPTSGFSGPTDASTPSEGTVLVDYVRVWKSAAAVEGGKRYTMQSKATGLCVEGPNAGARLSGCTSGEDWTFTMTKGGYYRATDRAGEALSVAGRKGQEWRLIRQGDGFALASQQSGLCLGARAASGALEQMACGGAETQTFVLTQQP